MRLILAAIGKLKYGPEQELVDRYLKRCRSGLKAAGFGQLDILELPESRKPDSAQRQEEEASRLLERLPDDCRLMIFDERGDTPSSQQFSKLLAKLGQSGAGTLAIIIGGPDGVSPELRQHADHVISFGQLTMPHQIVRALVAEQIYRATTILAGHPYHRE